MLTLELASRHIPATFLPVATLSGRPKSVVNKIRMSIQMRIAETA